MGWVKSGKQLMDENEHAVYSKYVSTVSGLSDCMVTE